LIIDVHAHYYPRRYLELIGRPGLPPAAAAALGGQDISERLALLDQADIDIQVLSVSQAQPYLPDPRAAAAALRLVLSGVPARFPRLKFIVPHLGGTLPFLLARISRKSADEVSGGLRTMYYDTVHGSAEALVSASRVYGPGRLLFGTDYPYCDEPQFRHHLSYLSEAGLGTGELDQVTGGTAAALLRVAGLPASWRGHVSHPVQSGWPKPVTARARNTTAKAQVMAMHAALGKMAPNRVSLLPNFAAAAGGMC